MVGVGTESQADGLVPLERNSLEHLAKDNGGSFFELTVNDSDVRRISRRIDSHYVVVKDSALPWLSAEEKNECAQLDEELYGMVLACLETTVGHEKATEKQKAEARELYAKVDAEMRSRDLESGIAAIAYIQRVALGERRASMRVRWDP